MDCNFSRCYSVAIADVMLKKATTQDNLATAITSLWFIGATGLYLFQISFFIFAFMAGWKLSVIGALQTALYAIIVLVAGVVLFKETLTSTQILGVLFAIGGVFLINWK